MAGWQYGKMASRQFEVISSLGNGNFGQFQVEEMAS